MFGQVIKLVGHGSGIVLNKCQHVRQVMKTRNVVFFGHCFIGGGAGFIEAIESGISGNNGHIGDAIIGIETMRFQRLRQRLLGLP